MLKSIKVEEDVYRKLDDLRGKRDTFSGVINRLLLIREGMTGLINVLEGQKAYAEYRVKELKVTTLADATKDSQ